MSIANKQETLVIDYNKYYSFVISNAFTRICFPEDPDCEVPCWTIDLKYTRRNKSITIVSLFKYEPYDNGRLHYGMQYLDINGKTKVVRFKPYVNFENAFKLCLDTLNELCEKHKSKFESFMDFVHPQSYKDYIDKDTMLDLASKFRSLKNKWLP